MVWIPGGTFWMGCEHCGMPDAPSLHQAVVDGFWIDPAPVTNAEFERFVTATRHVTVAERVEAGTRVPFIVRRPGHVRRGSATIRRRNSTTWPRIPASARPGDGAPDKVEELDRLLQGIKQARRSR